MTAERITFNARAILAKLEKALAETTPEMFTPVDPDDSISGGFVEAFNRQRERERRLALEYPYHYTLYFRAMYGFPGYEEALQLQKDSPVWCERNFVEGTWLYTPDMDGSLEFRFKSEEQLMLFKLRWHK